MMKAIIGMNRLKCLGMILKNTRLLLVLAILLMASGCAGTVTKDFSAENSISCGASSVVSAFSKEVNEPSENFQGCTSSQSPALSESFPHSSSQGENSPCISFGQPGDGGVRAVWWWDSTFLGNSKKTGEWLDFLEKNQVNRIYLCYPNFRMERMVSFVRKAHERGMEVSLLSGDCYWIDPQNTGADLLIEEYLDYQKNAPEDARFFSLHLDVEPHQREDYAVNKDQYLQFYADFAAKTYEKLHEAGELLEWDIPFWFDGMYVKDSEGKSTELLWHLCDNADTLCLMSYRDTAKEIFSVSQREIELCVRMGKTVICGVETFSAEGDAVSFMEEGKAEMYLELEELYGILAKETGGKKYGFAIHYLNTWMDLKD